MHKRIVKAGSVTHLSDARFFASYGAEYIGFCFNPLSPNYISPQEALAIKGWLHNVKIVAEFANQDTVNIKGIIEFLQPDILEISYADAEENTKQYFTNNLPVIINCHANELHKLKNEKYLFVLIEDYNGENISEIKFPVMLDITNKQFDFSNLHTAAFQIKGTPEQETGIKNYDELAELLEKITGVHI